MTSNSDLNSKVEARIKETLIDLIDDEEIHIKVDQVIERYFNNRKDANGYNKISEFESQVNSVLNNRVRDMIISIADSDAFKIKIKKTGEIAFTEIFSILTKNPQLLEDFVHREILTKAVSNFQVMLQSYMQMHFGHDVSCNLNFDIKPLINAAISKYNTIKVVDE